jgi:hypothetical protein
MTDTVRNAPYLQNVLRDNQPNGTIVAQYIRDFVVSALSTSVGVSAAGTTQASATVITSFISVITTVPASSGVILPSGVRSLIMNRGVNSLFIYPPVGGTLESLAANAPFSLQPGADAIILFDPSHPNTGYVTTTINVSSLSTTEPTAPGIVWNDGGVIAIS